MSYTGKSKLYDKIEWCTLLDMENKLIVYFTFLMVDYKVDDTVLDPDGVPLVRYNVQRVTRVRKMTDEEFEKYVKEFGMTMDIKLNMVYVSPEEMMQKQKDGKEKEL